MRFPSLPLPSIALRADAVAQGQGSSTGGVATTTGLTRVAAASSRAEPDPATGAARPAATSERASSSRGRGVRQRDNNDPTVVESRAPDDPGTVATVPAPTHDEEAPEGPVLPDPGAEGPGHAAEPLIALTGVSRHYGGAVDVAALEDATLAIWPGEFIVILGPSGSGKTTLLNLIGGMDQPSAGEIVAAGYRVSSASPGDLARYRRESVSFIFQTFNLFPALTALENVEFGASIARRTQPREAAAETLRQVGLGHRLGHFPHMLSGGEQQRVAIARALATGNSIVLADEPTGELDFRTGLQILELLQAQSATGRAVIVVTHNREIARVADRVIELSSGRIVSDRTVTGPRPGLGELHW